MVMVVTTRSKAPVEVAFQENESIKKKKTLSLARGREIQKANGRYCPGVAKRKIVPKVTT